MLQNRAMERPVGACSTVSRVFEPPVCFNVSHCDAATLCTACDGAWVVLGDHCTCSGSCLQKSPPMTMCSYLGLKLAANTALLLLLFLVQVYVDVGVAQAEEEIGGMVFLLSILSVLQLAMDANADIQGATVDDRIQLACLTLVYWFVAVASLLYMRARSRRRAAEQEALLQEAVVDEK